MRTIYPMLLLTAAVAVSACSTQIAGVTCSQEGAACPTGGVCYQGICVASCAEVDAGCGPSQSCVEDLASHSYTCVESFAALAITSPSSGATVPFSLPVTAKLERTAKASTTALGPGTVSLKAHHTSSNTDETFTLNRQADGISYRANVTLLHPGPYQLIARSEIPALTSPPVAITVENCASACPAGQECLAGQCKSILESLTIVLPKANSRSRPPIAFKVKAQQTAGALGSLPSTVDVAIAPSANPGTSTASLVATWVAASQRYEGALNTASDGSYQAVASSGTVKSPALTFLVDQTPPTIEIKVQLYPVRSGNGLKFEDTIGGITTAEYFRIDESLAVTVSSNEPLVPEPTALQVLSPDGGATATASLSLTPPASAPSCTGSFCRYAVIDRTSYSMKNRFNGLLQLSLTATDEAGNSASASAEARVSRLLWSKPLNAGPILTEPAIAPITNLGVMPFPYPVIVGTSTGTQSRLTAILQDGSSGFSDITPLEPQQLLVVPKLQQPSEVTVFGVGTLLGEARLFSANPQSSFGQQVNHFGCATAAGEPVALERVSIAMAVLNGERQVVGVGNERLTGAAQLLLATAGSCTAFALSGLGVASFESEPNLMVFDDYATFADSAGALHRLKLTGGTAGFDAQSHLAAAVGGEVLALAFTPDNNSLVGAATGGTGSFLFSLAPRATSLTSTLPLTGSAPRHLVVGENGNLLVGLTATSGSHSLRFQPIGLSGTATDEALAGALAGPPVLGWTTAAYLVTSGTTAASRQLRAIRDPGSPTASAIESWSWNLTSPARVSPTLDCRRDSAGVGKAGAPGVLTFGDDSGAVNAVLVDSPGFDPSSTGAWGPGWGKYRHDPMNTANADKGLSKGFSCP